MNTERSLHLYLLNHGVQEDEGACATDSCTAVHQQWLVQCDWMLLTDTVDKVDERHGILWYSVVRPCCVVEVCHCQGTLIRL